MLALAQVVRNRLRVFGGLLAVTVLLTSCGHKPQLRTMSFHDVMVADVNPTTRGQRVMVHGTVTYSDPEWRLLFIQDANDGAYLAPPLASEIHAGDHLQITGTTTDPSKLLEKTEFAVISREALMPEPILLKNASDFTKYPSKFVETVATVRWAGIRNGRATIEAYAGDARFQALVFPGTSEDLPRMGSEIRISGVSTGIYDKNGQLTGLQLLVPSVKRVELVKAGPHDPFTAPFTSVGELHRLPIGSLVHVSGRIMDRAESLAIFDNGHSATVNLRRSLHGDFASAEVVGFWSGSSIDDASLRPTGELLAHRGDIRSINELKHLTVAEASTRRPISVRAVVTYFDPYWGLLFVQDNTGAGFVNTRGLNLRLRSGDLVDISGVSGPGDYAPVIAEPAVSYVGHGKLPVPLEIDLVQGNLALADSQWCYYGGVVHSVTVVDGHTNLKIGAGDTALNVQVPTLIKGEQFLDKEISVTGALGILFNDRRQAIGHQIFVPSPEFISVVGDGGKPNPDSSITVLRRYSPTFDEHHSVGITGSVVLKVDANTIFVQDQTAGIQVRGAGPLSVNTGDRVHVRGFLRPGDYSPALEDAVVTKEGQGALPDPEKISAKTAADGLHDSEFISLHGVLADVRFSPGATTLVLNDSGIYFDVSGPAAKDLRSIRLGSEIEARGVCRILIDRAHVPYTISGFSLAFDSSRSITVLKPGPWWDETRIRWTLLLFALVAIGIALWAVLLRSKVRSKTLELQRSLAAKKKAQQFDQARNEVLESIARNAPLPENAERLALAIQEQVPDTLCAILLPPDGKSFQDGKPSPLLIAPGLPQESSYFNALSQIAQDAFKTDDPHVLSGDDDIVGKALTVLAEQGLRFASGHSALIFSASGEAEGILILLSKHGSQSAHESPHQVLLQSASRLVSLARDHWSMHERLLHDARHDILTGLPNRMVAEDRLEQALARAERRRKSFAVFCIDLDGFKAVNDELGHDAGDQLLRSVAARLRAGIRHSDTLARMGGDEFLAIIEDCAADSAAKSVADSLIASLKDAFVVEGQHLKLSASIGIATYPADGLNASQLRRNADQAMYSAKSVGGAQARFCGRDASSSATVQKSSTGR